MQNPDIISADNASSQKRNGTVLFADVVGFTSIAERQGEEAAFEMIRSVSTLMQEAIHAHGGTVGEFRGDGIMALFGVTAGLEDGPLCACKAALQIQSANADRQQDMTNRYGEAPQIRIGVHCGPLVVGDVGGKSSSHVTIIGDAANVASRLESGARPGQTVISDSLFALVEGQVRVRNLGAIPLKGKTNPQQIYALDAVREEVSRFEVSKLRGLSTLLDRDTELAELDAVSNRATSGEIVLANITGEAGIGKSRLLHEFERRLPQSGFRVLKGHCRAGGDGQPFLPFADLVRFVLRLDPDATPQDTSRQITKMLERMAFDIDAFRPYLLTLLGKTGTDDVLRGESPDMIGARMRQVLIDMISYAAQQASLVLVVEDMHWADRGTEQVIDQLAQLETPFPLLVLCTFRPTYHAPWRDHPRTKNIVPKPISQASVDVLIREIMAGAGQSAELTAHAVEKADGNPLYAEEIAKFLMQREVKGVAQPAVVLPANLQNMVMERFDRLDDHCRKLLQTASAIGRSFDARVAFQILTGTQPFDAALLDAAVKAELVLPSTTSTDGYRFKHALVQDAIYDTLLSAQRKDLHTRIGFNLEGRFSKRPEEAAETLAHHFDSAALPEKAVPYLIAAGTRNLNLFSLDAADRSFARAFELIERDSLALQPDEIAALFAGWFEVQQWRAEFGRTLALFEGQSERLQAALSDPRYPRILGLAGVAYCQNMQFDKAREKLDEAIAIGERTNDRDAIVYGCLGLMVIECTRPQPGYWERNHALIKRIKTLLGDEPHPYYRTYCTFYECWSHSIRGNFQYSITEGHALFGMGKEINFSGAVGWGAICIAYNEAQSENYEEAIEFATVGAKAAGGQVDRMVCLAVKGFCMLMTPQIDGNLKKGTEILQDIANLGDKLEYRGVENLVDGPLGLAKALGGDLGGGVQGIRAAIGNAMNTGNLHGAAQSHIALGMIYLLLATGEDKPDLAFLRKNLWFLLREAPFAKSRAIAQFDAAIELGLQVDMIGVTAQAMYGKAMVQRTMKKTLQCRATLLEAQKTVQNIDWPMMRDRIDDALAELA